MKKIVKCVLTFMILSFVQSQGNSQPLETSPIAVEEIKLNGKELFFTSKYTAIGWVHTSTPKREKQYAAQYDFYISVRLTVNSETYLINKQDTMSIKIIYDEYSPFQFVFEELRFKKGKYIIDLRSCFPEVKVYPLVVKDIFCDCKKYIRKEE